MKKELQNIKKKLQDIKKYANHASAKKLQKLQKLRQNFLKTSDQEISNLLNKANFLKFVSKNSSVLKNYRKSIWHNLLTTKLRYFLSLPFIYSMIFPMIILYIFLEIYHQICFRLYGIDLVKRSEYIIIDRHKLPYLNGVQKLNCVYCGCFNGLIAYTREIAARTEEKWCPIKHAKNIVDPHKKYHKFVEYPDAEGFLKNKK